PTLARRSCLWIHMITGTVHPFPVIHRSQALLPSPATAGDHTRGAGRPPATTDEQIRHARDLFTRPVNTVSSIARLLGVSRSTIYKYVPELTTTARPAIGQSAAELEAGH
ncbi:helix-turn-helix domain-containing protein, partial [Nonomuraea sp. NPDC049625]|uniref:helix-turn-helix domain-containing protein n=1 Tax=Nonomuraea sp. NPDC049625 TaxID=3155775 RepID=UPI00342F39DA